jgi:Membrane dipeptidase (Peptidase family M19)
MGMEGGHMINNSLPVLRMYAQLGVRYLTLTHSVHTDWADSSGDQPKHNGLTGFGKEVVRELNRLGVMVDVSHVSDKTFFDALEVSAAPMIASHSSCRALSDHPRNMTDEMIKALAAKGGVIQINYLDSFIDPALAEYSRKAQPLMREFMEKNPGEGSFARAREEAAKVLGPGPKASWEKIVEHIEAGGRRSLRTRIGLRRRPDAGRHGRLFKAAENHRSPDPQRLQGRGHSQDSRRQHRAPAGRCRAGCGAPAKMRSPTRQNERIARDHAPFLSMTMRNGRVTVTKVDKLAYGRLLIEVLPAAIETEEENRRMIAIIDRMMAKP